MTSPSRSDAPASLPSEAPAPSLTTTLTVGGMTCAACVGRVERKLGRLDGVAATVNLATGRATVRHPAAVSVTDLVTTVEAAGFTARPHEPAPAPDAEDRPSPAGRPDDGDDGDAARAERHRLLVTAALSLPVLVLSMVPGWQFRDWQWLCFVLAAPVAVWGSAPFHARALRGLRHGAATMDTLVSLGVVASFTWSAYALFLGGAGAPGMTMPFSLLPAAGDGTAHLYLEAAVGVPLFVLAGRRMEARARRGTGAALRALAELAAKDVEVRTDGDRERGRRIPVDRLRAGDRFLVRPGERVATDGTVVEGGSALDLSLISGESRPVEVGPGDAVVGGALNSGGLLEVRADAVGADTQLARITRLVEDAQTGKTTVQRLADAVAAVFVPGVLTVSVTVLGFWLGAGADPQSAITAAVAVLVVACPCALGLATPTALLAATGRGAQLGILVRGPEALERLRRIDTVVLDKTGTLTTGRMSVTALTARTGGLDATEALRLAAVVEQGSEHPLARAIGADAAARLPDRPLPPVRDFAATPGYGVRGTADGYRVEVTRPGDLTGLPAPLPEAVHTAETAGHTAVLVTVDGTPEAVLAVGDTLRPDGYRAVDHLRRLGLRPVLATGDREATARAIAGHLAITEVHAGASPEDKAALVTTLKEQGARVAVVGDGVNDAAALALADLGIAMGSGTDAAIGAADVTLVREDLQAIPDAVRLARRTLGTIRGNLVWAFGYNLVTLPLAAVGLLSPMPAAAAMSASSLLVVGNSLRLRAWRPGGPGSRDRRPHGRRTRPRGETS
ncbi:heavy metal translocating P-type ATPase [Streptomyces angustmyceticus]|uniref:Cation-transporting P-type ATPase B n=1 Tax=Streptomyces angustmyceticus TaxID=285578 RepID=A0A5J4L7K1_9ACTN|nr:heavy metal translocating P-type ATPase [Streptomyces angustmyceticus]UAL70605.1 cadmium-translocating P-type ATPase [Streptomyces angustmyceticus]GES30103.1 carbonate dehydratase [Streptomyces angustmyceticus]